MADVEAMRLEYLQCLGAWMPTVTIHMAMRTITELRNASGDEEVAIVVTDTNTKRRVGGQEVTLVEIGVVPVSKLGAGAVVTRIPRRLARFDALGEVHEYFAGLTHREAVSCIRRAAENGESIALYLRSFDLSARADEATEMSFPEMSYPLPQSGFPVVATQINPGQEDARLQEVLLSHGVRNIVAIANPRDPIQSGSIPKILVSDDMWQVVLHGLVKLCKPIVVLIASPSPGVLYELRQIVNSGKASHTVLVIYNQFEPLELSPFPRETPKELLHEWEQLLTLFPHVVAYEKASDDLPHAWNAAMAAPDVPISGDVIIPGNFGPLTAMTNRAAEELERLLDEAAVLMEKGELRKAEDLVYEAAVFAAFANSDSYRAVSYLVLGQLAAQLGSPDEAHELIVWAKELVQKSELHGLAGAVSSVARRWNVD
jgi:hypothetical protein